MEIRWVTDLVMEKLELKVAEGEKLMMSDVKKK